MRLIKEKMEVKLNDNPGFGGTFNEKLEKVNKLGIIPIGIYNGLIKMIKFNEEAFDKPRVVYDKLMEKFYKKYDRVFRINEKENHDQERQVRVLDKIQNKKYIIEVLKFKYEDIAHISFGELNADILNFTTKPESEKKQIK